MHFGLTAYAPPVLYVGSIVALLLSVFWRPQIGFYYLVPLLPMQTARYWLHPYFLGEKLVDILLLGVLLGLFLRKQRPIFVSSPVNKVVIFLCILTYISLWQGALYLGTALPITYLDPRFSDWKNYVEMMFLFFVAAAAIRTRKQMVVVLVLMCLSVVQVNRTYHSTIGDRDFSHFSYELRDAGPLGYAGENGMGAFQAQTAVLLIGLAAFAKSRVVKFSLWAIAGTCVYALVITLSRGGYLGFLTGLLALGVLKQRKLLLLLLVILVSWQSLIPGAARERILMTYQDSEGLDSSAGERITLWEDALKVIQQNPATGTGFDTYRFMGRSQYADTHNYYVKVLLETGVVGLVILLWLLQKASVIAWKLFRERQDSLLSSIGCAVFGMLSCIFVANLFGDRWTYLQVNGFFWILLGFIARGLFMLQTENDAKRVEAQELWIESVSPQEVSPA